MAAITEKMPTDVEKQPTDVESHSLDRSSDNEHEAVAGETYVLESRDRNILWKWAFDLDEKIGVEAHGMEPTPPSNRTTDIPYFDMAALWMSSNGVAGSIPTGLIGPVVYGLSLKSSMIICVFINMLGALLPAFSSTFGPKYGFRQMIVSRYSFGFYGTKWICLLEFITNLGWSLVTALVGAELMVSLTNDKLPIVPSIIVIAVIALVVATFGYRFVHFFTRYAWAVSFFVMIVFATINGPNFDASFPSQGSGAALAGNTLSFMGVIFGSACGYTPVASDYYCNYPADTPWWKPFGLTWLGIVVAGILFNGVGAAFGSAVMANAALGTSYTNDGFGAVVALSLEPLQGFGKFCIALWWLGTAANLIGNTYSNSIDAQIFGFGLDKIPRFMLAIISTILYAVIAIAGRDKLIDIFQNFLSILAYWVSAYFVIIFEEHFLFRYSKGGYDRTVWNAPRSLPPGIAAIVAFWIGIIGACMGMSQVWFVGPLSKHFGPYGGDLGTILTSVFVAVTYPGLRLLERNYFKR